MDCLIYFEQELRFEGDKMQKSMMMLMAVAILGVGCAGEESVYCIAEVRAEDQEEGTSGPGFYNEDLVGTTICYGDRVTRSWCDDRDGQAGDLEVYENGAEEYCTENGYSYNCGSEVYVASAGECSSDDDTVE